ncbi:MAG: hypothetical protein L0215_17275 [Gemmataceae bacterium]|nr:hypothetical protein [Gemmataceae bacterium]
MAQPIKPVAKSVYVCDDVVRDPQTGKVSLLNMWDTIRVPVGVSFPFVLATLCVFAWWRDGLGSVRTRIDVVQASPERVIRRTKDCVIDFDARNTTVYGEYKLRNFSFPAPG